jgi:hypothetical protein
VLTPSKGTASQVVKAGNDVYVAGVSGEAGLGLPSGPAGIYAYWKNGQQVDIGDTMFLRFGPSLAVAGGSLYFSNGPVWHNGATTPLPGQGVYGRVWELFSSGNPGNGYPAAFSLFVSGSDVYVGGDDAAGKPAYWKNGAQQNLLVNGAKFGSANDICVSDTTVYVVGSTADGAVCWKNGVETVLAPVGAAQSVIVQ